jgi:hypothetical protein
MMMSVPPFASAACPATAAAASLASQQAPIHIICSCFALSPHVAEAVWGHANQLNINLIFIDVMCEYVGRISQVDDKTCTTM